MSGYIVVSEVYIHVCLLTAVLEDVFNFFLIKFIFLFLINFKLQNQCFEWARRSVSIGQAN